LENIGRCGTKKLAIEANRIKIEREGMGWERMGL
jgi:hypothetical protein